MTNRAILFVVLTTLLSPNLFADDAPATTPSARLGPFTTSFSKRSPLSSTKELALRLKEKKVEPDYDLSKEEYFVYVPKDYDPRKPQGILLLLNYKHSVPPADRVLAFCDSHRLIFVTPTDSSQEPRVKCGLGLDCRL